MMISMDHHNNMYNVANNDNDGVPSKKHHRSNMTDEKELFWDAEGSLDTSNTTLALANLTIKEARNYEDQENIWMDMMVVFLAMVQTAIANLAISCHDKFNRAVDFMIDVYYRVSQSFVMICTTLPETILRFVLRDDDFAEEIIDSLEQFLFDVRNHRLVKIILTGEDYDDEDSYHLEEETDAADYIDHVDFVHRVRYEHVQLDG